METVKKYWFVPVLIIICIGLYVGVKNGFTGFLESFGLGGSSDQQKKELDNIEINRKNLTLSDSDAVLISQQLMAAMDQWGTDSEAIIRLLTGKNRDDLLLIIKTFGIQPYNGLGKSQAIDKFLYSVDLNLQGWLTSELSGKDLADVTTIFNKNNISF